MKLFKTVLCALMIAASLQAASSQEDAERRVLVREINSHRAELDMPALPADTSKLTLEMLRSEDAMLTGAVDEQRAKIAQARAVIATPTPMKRPAPKSGGKPALTAESLNAAKAAFPAAEKRRVSVIIKNARPQNDTQRRAREDTIEVEVPPRDLYADLKSDMQTATLDSWPVVLKRIDMKIEAARRQARGAVNNSTQWSFATGQTGDAQARYTYEWLDQQLVPFLAKLR